MFIIEHNCLVCEGAIKITLSLFDKIYNRANNNICDLHTIRFTHTRIYKPTSEM